MLWGSLVGVALLAALSIVGAFKGDQWATGMFNSWPLAAFWVLLTIVLAAGLAAFKRLRTSPGLLALHLGSVLIFIGSMVGSDTGHRLINRALGKTKVPFGYVIINENESNNLILLPDKESKKYKEIGRLPFSLHLNDFMIEYYAPADPSWLLYVESPSAEVEEDEHGHAVKAPAKNIKWVVGEEVAIGDTEARMTVLQYFEGSRPTFSEGALEIVRAGGETMTVPAKEGEEVSLEDPEVKLRIVQVFSHLRVEGRGESRRIIDVPGLAGNPALKIEQTFPDGRVKASYVMPNFPAHDREESRVDVRYRVPEPIGAVADLTNSLPAMEVLLRYKDKELRRWLVARAGMSHVGLPLADLLEEPADASHEGSAESGHGEGEHKDGEEHANTTPTLYLVKPAGQVSDYKSDLVVLEEGQEQVRKTIEVNDPLHYGGYHFYQHSYDSDHGRYTVLSMRSDLGLLSVYAGFFLVGVGAVWLFWVGAALGHLRQRRSDGD